MTLSQRRFELKKRTSEAHASLDGLIGSLNDFQSYTRYLRGIASFRLSVEAHLNNTPWPPQFGDWRSQQIGGTIMEDLADLQIEPSPSVEMRFDARSADELLGVHYVLQGSALGARLLWQQAQALGLNGTHGARHLHRQSNSIADWGAFLSVLEASEPFDIDRAAAASDATFRAAYGAFKSYADVDG